MLLDRKIVFLSLGLVLTFCLCGCGGGKEPPRSGGTQTEPESSHLPDNPPVKLPVNPPVKPATEADRKKAELNNTEWQVRLIPQSGKDEERADVLRFINNKFSSETFVAKDFVASNYTLRVKGEEVECETMQTNEEGGTLSWRIQIRDGKMRGVLVAKPKKGQDEVLSVVSTSSRKIQPPPPEEEKSTEKTTGKTTKDAAKVELPREAETDDTSDSAADDDTAEKKGPTRSRKERRGGR